MAPARPARSKIIRNRFTNSAGRDTFAAGCFVFGIGVNVSELEIFGLDGWRGWFRRNTGHPFVPAPGQTCLNCDTEIKGEFCYHCGQNADTHHRTVGHLIFEVFEGLFHLDGRLWTTLPPLFFQPGKLARDLMEGRVARHIPPFRIFLVALLVFMLVAEHVTEEHRLHPVIAPPAPHMSVATIGIHETAPAASASASSDADDVGNMISDTAGKLQSTRTTTTTDKKTGAVNVVHNIDVFSMTDDDARLLARMVAKSNVRPDWLKADLIRALDNKERFFASVFTWGHRLALLLLPIVGLSLGLLYLKKRKDGRRFYLYDHLLVAMNLLSFMFLIGAIGMVLPDSISPAWQGIGWLWTLWTFFSTLRGAYGSSIPGAILKSLVLWIMTWFGFSLVITGVIFISLTVG